DKRGGLLPAIAQEKATGDILMIGSINQEAFAKAVSSRMATFWSTSRNALWTKGETSGEWLKIIDILIDCDQDAVIYQVELSGSGACHTKDSKGQIRKSCFYRKLAEDKQLEFLPGSQ
ncbi:MAG: phosphoribosyl-AMP cyclohydrolase, partial [Spirochaetota bacterium]